MPIRNHNNNVMDCPSCGWVMSIDELYSKDGFKIYHECTDCRRKHMRERQKMRRSKIKAEKEMRAASQLKLHHDLTIRLARYLITQAGPVCQYCGYNRNMRSLILYSLDGIVVNDILQSYIDTLHQDSWQQVIDVYHRCIPMCLTCANDARLGIIDVSPKMYLNKTVRFPSFISPDNLASY